MKKLKLNYLFVVFMFFSLALSACNNSGNNAEVKTEESQELGKEYTSAYVCPMHCEGSGGDEAGDCPVCGMEYQMNEDYNEEDHEGHNH